MKTKLLVAGDRDTDDMRPLSGEVECVNVLGVHLRESCLTLELDEFRCWDITRHRCVITRPKDQVTSRPPVLRLYVKAICFQQRNITPRGGPLSGYGCVCGVCVCM